MVGGLAALLSRRGRVCGDCDCGGGGGAVGLGVGGALMASEGRVAGLRIALQGIEPLIWRRVAVPTAMTLSDVHRVIQAVMGWLDYHLWHFEVGERRYAMRVAGESEWNELYEDAGRMTLGALLDSGLRRMEYVYDMGDFWEHSIIVEKVGAPEPKAKYPQFLGGERRCPPEDCGSVPGYYEFLENITSAEPAERKSALDWYGGPYDAEDIDELKIVRALGKIARGRAS
ncbi:MAG: plasmid pRiA4b ORF-3 family protein [Xanthobacteraceae bacterium]